MSSISVPGRRSRGARGPVALRRREQVLFLLPAFAFLLAFYIVPNFLNFGASLTSWSTFSSTIRFVGLDNFGDLVNSGGLWEVIGRTIVFAIAVTVIENLVALGLALALEKPTRQNIYLRAVFFVPGWPKT